MNYITTLALNTIKPFMGECSATGVVWRTQTYYINVRMYMPKASAKSNRLCYRITI